MRKAVGCDLLLLGWVLSWGTAAQAADGGAARVMTWRAALEAVRGEPALAPNRKAFLEGAGKAVAKEPVRRARKLADVGKRRTWLDGRAEALEPEIKETFALAMSDFAACNTLAVELPLLAAAWRLSGDERFQRRVVEQLDEMATWRPLQRPGWTLYAPGHRLPADGQDGNWLATGCGVRAIVTTLDIMGKDVPAGLRGKLDDLLAAEIAGVVDDWRTKRPWFVRTDNPITNQWVLPTEGLVTACVHLGRDTHREAYELGVKNLLAALDSHGTDGEFEEGIGYASFTVTSLVHAARAMAAAGDRRAIEHPFLANFPTWAVLHIQPGRMTVNCFDAGNAIVTRDNVNWRSLLSLLVFTLGSEVANWALHEPFVGPTDDLIGLVASAASGRVGRKVPPLFAAYERATMVVWRDSWRDEASGVWVRGGHKLDQHDHQDRGHVNVIHKGRALLIEAGTPSYSNPVMGVEYASGAGHNVLQVGTFFPPKPYPVQKAGLFEGWQRRGSIAPIDVQRLDAKGGAVTVAIRGGYPDVASWGRRVSWSAGRTVVEDRVSLKPGTSDVILFRWHTGSGEAVSIKVPSGGASVGVQANVATVTWPGAEIRFEADAPITVTQRMMPDATLAPKEDHMHACVEVRTRGDVASLVLKTTVLGL